MTESVIHAWLARERARGHMEDSLIAKLEDDDIGQSLRKIAKLCDAMANFYLADVAYRKATEEPPSGLDEILSVLARAPQDLE